VPGPCIATTDFNEGFGSSSTIGEPGRRADSVRLASLTGGSMVILAETELENLARDAGQPGSQSTKLLTIALLLASAIPAADSTLGSAVDA